MILVDTDVLIDDALDRYPHSIDSKEFLRRLEQGSLDVFIAWHTVSNAHYINYSPTSWRRGRPPVYSPLA